MNNLLKLILSLSLSGTLLIIVLFLLKPLWKDRTSKQWQYYIWIIVVMKLILPFAPKISLVGNLFGHIDQTIIQIEQNVIHKADISSMAKSNTQSRDFTSMDMIKLEAEPNVAPLLEQNLFLLSTYILLIWLFVALVILVRKITIYQDFVRYLKAGQVLVSDIDVLEHFAKIISEVGVKNNIELVTNNLISSPLLMGFFRPCIVLPTIELSDSEFRYIVLHELTHYRRWDMFYKWLVQFTICLHWFNPFLYLMGREVSRACELSCDEAVIRKLNTKEQQSYGDTLLNAMGAKGNYKDSLSSVTLNESKELLKERLDAIMKFKYQPKIMRLFMVFLTVLLCLGSTFTGAYGLDSSRPHDLDNSKQSVSQVPVKSYKNDLFSYQVGTSVLFGQYNNQAIKWNILEINSKNEALLFAADVLPNMYLPFDKISNIWETSFIRTWLNGTQKGEFLSDNNFTKEERDAIIQAHLFNGILGNATYDYIFLISKEEYWQYNVGDVSYDVNSYWSRTGEANTKGIDYPGSVALFSSNHQVNGSFNASESSGIRPMMWVDVSALAKASNNTNQANTTNQETTSTESYANINTISVNIQKTDNLILAQHGRRYQVYGPFNGSSGDSVSCVLNNDIEAHLEMIISSQGKAVENVEMSNTIGIGKIFTGTLFVDVLNNNQQFYVFIGSDNIKNLTGTISLAKQ